MASEKGVRGHCNEITPAAEDDILKLLDKKKESVEDTKDLWNYLQNNKLIRMGDEKGLIRSYLQENDITRMWEIAACKYEDIKVLMALNDAAAAVKAVDDVLPGKWIGKRGQKKGGWDSFLFPWASSSKGFPFKEEFEMTISNGDKPNEYRVRFGGIGGDNPNEHRIDMQKKRILLSVKRKVDPVPEAVKHCVAAFTFGDGSNTLTDQITVYIRFAGPTMLVGKAFKANWATNSDYENLWGDLVLAKY